MEYSAWHALAKGDYFVWFLILVVLVVGLCWEHYQRAWQDIVGEDMSSQEPGTGEE